MGRFALGVVGYSHWNLDIFGAWLAVANGIEYVLGCYSLPQDTEIVLVSGLTYYGIPALAYEYAKIRGWKTVGIACNKAITMDCFAVTEEPRYVGDDWGDESETFLEYLFTMADRCAMLRVGGGLQSFDEVARFVKRGGTAYQFEFPCYPRDR